MELKHVIEALVFLSQRPISSKDIRSVLSTAESPGGSFRGAKENDIIAAIEQLKSDYQSAGRSFTIREVAGGFQLISLPEYAPWAKQLFEQKRSSHLSQPALETLAIIAYRQPITRAEIESVRGVNVDAVLKTLLERNLVTITGRSKAPGQPLQYGTTQRFLEHFGLPSLENLPQSAELKLRPPQKTKSTAQETVAPSVPPQEGSPAGADSGQPSNVASSPTTEESPSADEQ